MTYRRLIAEHEAIEAAALVVVTLADPAVSRPGDAANGLEILAQLLRDHLAHEDAVIYQTVLSARGGRYADAATTMNAQLDQLKDDWESYLYRWDASHIVASWTDFCKDTHAMLGRIRERVVAETAVLYSLALHFDVIAAE